ncbi:RNA-guided endonuclease InsQ/TnpB family protein [Parafrankia sp. FMc2]|uniref:RNA-guided endonuclease InsQ/TnpB family protein n=1 Tax=Parafrankia sp. FMc2 TaxID=3233196 RepID=UPI0034D5C7D9
MRRAFRFQLRPTARQVAALTAMLDDHRALYNAALQERRDAWRHPSRTSVRYTAQAGQLSEIRAFDPDQARWSYSSQQATLRRLDKAMAAFFRRVRAGQTPGYPRFKGRNRFDTVDWPKDGDGCRWDSDPNHPTRTRVRLQGVGHLKVNQHRPVRGTVRTVSVRREGRRWYVVVSCADVPTEPLPATGSAVGVDLGVASLATTSGGVHYANPRFAERAAGRLAAAQRDLIAVEALNVGGMTRRARARPDPDAPGAFLPNGQGAKSGLNRNILDAGWGVFLNVLHAKAESAGRVVVEVNPANTSRTCAACGHCAAENRRTQAEFVCTACGHTAHADVNAAANILRVGLARQAAQAA